MNSTEKTLLRILFKNQIHQCGGQEFEDIFISVMNYAEKNFTAIKPWGNIGDRKNDGYVEQTGTYYQVFAPEDIRKSYPSAVRKLHTDFEGLIKQWGPVKSFYFVINDRYKGVNPDAEQAIQKIKEKYSLKNAAILTVKDIENKLFELEEDQVTSIVGFLPDPSTIKIIDYSILSEVIGHIMSLPIQFDSTEGLTLPDWDEKIHFNNLSSTVASYLNTASYQLHNLEEYLSNNGDFVADELRIKMSDVYHQKKTIYSGDELFMSIINHLSPEQTQSYQNNVIIIMAKYFETCDIFEEPKEDTENDYAN